MDAADITLRGAKVARFDGGSLQFESKNVVIEDGRIIELATPDQQQDSHIQRSIDVTGLYLMPGLIDLHTHVASSPALDDDEEAHYARQLNESLELRTKEAVAAAQATLYAGFTTIRDVSTEGAGFLDVTLAKAIEDGVVLGPRIIPSTLGLATTGGYFPFSADGRSKPQGAQTADTEAELLAAVQYQHAHGAKWIKIFADFPKSRGSKSVATYSREHLRLVTAEARRLGLRVAAHVLMDEAAMNCVDAGVDTIEHGFGLSENVMRMMQENGVVLIPTINALLPEEGTGDDDQWVRGIAERIARSGVVIGVGSDAGSGVDHGSNFSEIYALVELGFSVNTVLSAATIVGAEVLGRTDELGQIEVGYIADLVAYRKNPLDDIKTISEPVLVVKDGLVVFDTRE